jgi:hypothetical protein
MTPQPNRRHAEAAKPHVTLDLIQGSMREPKKGAAKAGQSSRILKPLEAAFRMTPLPDRRGRLSRPQETHHDSTNRAS